MRCEEYGYGLGGLDGILVLKYASASHLDFGESRQDLLHQLYWSPDGVLAAWHRDDASFVGSHEAYWVHRAVTHEVRAGDRQTVYRVCLREVPPALAGLRAGAVRIDAAVSELIREIAAPGVEIPRAVAARARIMTGLGPPADPGHGPEKSRVPEKSHGPEKKSTGYAVTVARTLSRDPADPRTLADWADRLHVSAKTLQRDFVREFGMPYSRWRALLRLRASRVLLANHQVAEVARRVGYATPSAFITAFTREYGCTPGRYAALAPDQPAR
ncbi:AraC family transcriptional regulator [Spongiactinospora gelatinilytica]|uniref:AraC family transcriptional regulator n=1 Tax=Spongiactinospora gelatinilytica TaxID=2666298 RepID=A0A2W2G6C7_9ACTN|nr:AraC family transcriptional regulator [Spongiactinospora gelatinilytica]